MNVLDVAIKIAFFVCTMQMFSAFFDLKYYAPFIEIFRCAGVLLFYVIKYFDAYGFLLNRIFMSIFFAICLIFWTIYSIFQVNI